jgi:integrase
MLTDIVIKQAKAEPGKRLDILDTDGQKGLGVRIGKKKSFFVKYVFDGKKRRLTLGDYSGMTLAQARLKAQEALVYVQNGIDPGLAKQEEKKDYSQAPTIKNLIQELWDKKLSKLKSGKNTKRLLEKDLLKPWGNRKTASITPRQVALLLDEVAERAPVTRNRLQSAIFQLFNFAVVRGIIDVSPCPKIERIEEKTRDRVLNDDEIILLWNALDLENPKPFDAYPITKLALKMILLTGQRPGEIAGMEWAEIVERKDGTWWEIPAERMKGKTAKPHDVPLSPLSIEIIEQAKFYSGTSRFVFQSNFKKNSSISVRAISRTVSRHWESIKVKKFTPHDLRRTCRTGLAILKISDIVAEKILSHSLQGVLGIYNRATYEPERRAALVLWESHIMSLVNPGSTSEKQGITDLNSYRAAQT